MTKKILEMQNVTKRFPGVIALDNVSIDLNEGEILGICGENGAGKSTLMKVLSGSYSSSQYEGKIIINGEKCAFSCVDDAQKSGIEMVYQEMNMMLDISVAENLFVGNLPTKNGFVDYTTLYKDTAEALSLVGMTINPKSPVRPLNSGQMQMISILRARAKKPKILVLDEPTSALAEKDVKVLFGLLRKMRDEGISCIYISHKLQELFDLCDRVAVIRDGHSISCRPISEVRENVLIEEMVGRKVDNLYPKESIEIGDTILEVKGLSVPHPNIKGKNIVENIAFTLRKGEILGIGGLVGAGRSEILGAIFGQYRNHITKQVFIEGKEVKINTPRDAIKNGMGFITEERKLNGIFWMLSIRENISIASLKRISGKLFINKKKEEQEVGKVYKDLRIKAPSVETKLVNLSGGNQQKVILAKWLMNNPRILLIDEPTKGIDVGTKADFYKIMGDLTKQGVSIIMVSSDMPELIAMSDRVLVISGGQIAAELTGKDISDVNVMKAAIAY